MKNKLLPAVAVLAVAASLSGCLNLQFGGGSTAETAPPTMGRQLTDLKKAKDAGAITEEEYREQRAKILGHSCSKKN